MSPMPRYGKITDLEVLEPINDVEKGGTALIWWLSRCSKLIAYMNLIKKVMLSNASTPSFGLYAQLSSVV